MGLLPVSAQQDVAGILLAQGQLIPPQIHLNGVAEGGDFLYRDGGARGKPHVHQPPLHCAPVVAHRPDDPRLSGGKLLEGLALGLRFHCSTSY